MNEKFNMLELLHKFRYPFPTLKNPYAEQLQEITENQWIDGEYLWLYENNPNVRKKYKKTKTAHIAAQWFPTASAERFRPICRLMLWTLYNDDLYEESEPGHEAWQNDFYSLRKELGLDTELMNLILVLKEVNKMSLEEAVNEAKRIHDADVAEFVALHENLPDFGVHQQQVYDYILSLGTILQGLNTHYIQDTERYLADGVGFAWPEADHN